MWSHAVTWRSVLGMEGSLKLRGHDDAWLSVNALMRTTLTHTQTCTHIQANACIGVCCTHTYTHLNYRHPETRLFLCIMFPCVWGSAGTWSCHPRSQGRSLQSHLWGPHMEDKILLAERMSQPLLSLERPLLSPPWSVLILRLLGHRIFLTFLLPPQTLALFLLASCLRVALKRC